MHLILMVMAIRLAGLRGSVGGEFVRLVFRRCECDLLRVDGPAFVASFSGVEDRRRAASLELIAGAAAFARVGASPPPQLPILLHTFVFRLTCILD